MAEGQRTQGNLATEETLVPNVHEAAAQAATTASNEAILTSIADRDRANTQRQLAEEQLIQLRQNQAPTPRVRAETPLVQLIYPHDPHWIEGAGCGILCLLAALAVAAVMAYGLWLGWLRSFQPTVDLAPVQVPAPVIRTFGTVDISMVAVGDQGIDWFNPVAVGVYQLRQNSTGLFITDRGNAVLVDRSGTRVFR